MILVGVDPHKHTHTLVAMHAHTRQVIDQITVSALPAGHQQATEWIAGLGGQVLVGIEDIRNLSGRLEQDLLAAGLMAVRVPPKAMGTRRRQSRTRGKSDAIDAAAIALAAPEYTQRPVSPEPQWLVDLTVLMGDRDGLVGERTRICSRLGELMHRIDPELSVRAGGLSATRTLNRLATALADHTGIPAAVALELCQRISTLTTLINTRTHQIQSLVAAHSPQLVLIPGCGPINAARILIHIRDITRFANSACLARHAGIAPIPASSGTTNRHRLDRTGNRQLNYAIHQIALTQARTLPAARAYIARRRHDGKTYREALRCLKRHLTNTIYRSLSHGPTWTPSLT